jgi:heme/copper-type cytochrome/quinol oxidase subunit 2
MILGILAVIIYLCWNIPSWIIMTVVIGICLLFVILSLSFMWREIRRRYPKKTTGTPSPTSGGSKSFLPKFKDNWQWPLAVVICEVLLSARFPAQYWVLASSPWFWVVHIVGAIVFWFFREPDKKAKDKDQKKLTTAGKLILTALALIILANFLGISSEETLSTGSVKTDTSSVNGVASSAWHRVSSKLPFGDGMPEENKKMHDYVVKFWQSDEGLPGNYVGQQKMIRIADEASRFNQFEPGSDGKLPFRHEIRGRWKVGIAGIDERLWAEVGNDASLTKSAHHNLLVASYLYRTYGDLPWSRWLTKNSRVVIVPASGWSEKIPMGHRQLHLHPSEAMTVTNDKGKEYRVTLDANGEAFLTVLGKVTQDFPYTEWVQYASVSGKPAIVLVTPHNELNMR